MDNLISFTVSSWGITFSSSPIYFNMSWGMIITATALVIIRKVVLNRRAKALWQQAIDDEAKRG